MTEISEYRPNPNPNPNNRIVKTYGETESHSHKATLGCAVLSHLW